jgi:hypothetical protein
MRSGSISVGKQRDESQSSSMTRAGYAQRPSILAKFTVFMQRLFLKSILSRKSGSKMEK